MVVCVLSAASNTFELLAAPDEDSLPTQVWYIAYVYGPYAAWAFFFLTLILLMWITYRLARNLHGLAPNRFLMSPTFAVGYYLVPIANIFMPPRVTGLIARITFTAVEAPRNHNATIGWWWGTFLLAALLSNVATVIASSSGAYDHNASFDSAAYESSLSIGIAAWISNFVACYFMLRVFEPLVRAQAWLVRNWTTRGAA